MNNRFAILGMALAGVLAAGACGFAQPKKQPDPKQLQKAFEAYARVGKEHAHFQRLAGHWNCVVKDYFSNPIQPTTSKGTATFRVIMGGRFLQQRFQGKMGGQSFEGMGVSGFDNAKKNTSPPGSTTWEPAPACWKEPTTPKRKRSPKPARRPHPSGR